MRCNCCVHAGLPVAYPLCVQVATLSVALDTARSDVEAIGGELADLRSELSTVLSMEVRAVVAVPSSGGIVTRVHGAGVGQ